MNIGVAMQYARDRMGMPFKSAVEALEEFLIKKINRNYGMWFEGKVNSSDKRNEMIRGMYHILPIFYYDNIELPYSELAIRQILLSQNKWGGFDKNIGSSACADIDGLDPLLRLTYKKNDIDSKKAILKARNWILFNQNPDGGFVFERNREFIYGSQRVLFSKENESNLFATWFRCLSLELVNTYLEEGKAFTIDTPGYECRL